MIDEMQEVSTEKKSLDLLEGNERWFTFLENKRETLNVLLANSISSYFNFKMVTLLKAELQNKDRYQFNHSSHISETLPIEFLTSGIMGIMIHFIHHPESDSKLYDREITSLLEPYLICSNKKSI